MGVKRDKYELEWIVVLMSTNSKFQINTSDTIKCISSSEDGRKIAFGNNSGDIFLVDNEGKIIWEKNIIYSKIHIMVRSSSSKSFFR